ncbi:branched-chain amino acid aminotransferase II [Meredithblackwellia eburnea MCA 4105]
MGSLPPVPSPDPAQLKITRAQSLKPVPKNEPSLPFGEVFTDHMLTIQWSQSTGWDAPEIRPYEPFQLDPASMVLHHAMCLFEGMKAYRDKSGAVRIFRPDMNMKRMNKSAARLLFPQFDPFVMTELIKKVVEADQHWVPTQEGYSLYLRPTMIANGGGLGGKAPSKVLFFVIMSPCGPYHATGFKPVSLMAMSESVRAWPGGTGSFKLGANYAGGYRHQAEVAQKGHQAILWLHGPEHALTEVGMMNLCLVFKKDDGTIELTTCPLNDMILPGVTRDSVLTLARDHSQGRLKLADLPDNLIVTERVVLMSEVVEAAKNGSLLEMFGTGTAAIVSAVNRVEYQGEMISVPVEESGMGKVCQVMLRELVGRQRGDIPSPWSIKVTEGTSTA